MKQPEDRITIDLIYKPGRGRPRQANALTPAQRAKLYRARQALMQRAKLA